MPQAGWRALDVATGGGHTALAFAPYVAEVVALDLTHDILRAARRHLTAEGAANAGYVQADAEVLPFAHASFDLVTCRIAAHHFPDAGRFVRDAARVTRSGGWVAITDNVTPDDEGTAMYLNAFERLRDPSHSWEHSLADWLIFFADAGLEVTHHESRRVFHDFDAWAARMSVSEGDQVRLRVMLKQAPEGAREALAPKWVGSGVEFNLQEAIIVGRR
jgi:SAM-dependent methyltransferase